MNLILLLVLGTMWGASFIFVKIIVDVVPPMTLVAGRLLMSGIATWLIVLIRRIPIPRDRKTWQAFAVVGLLNGALPFTLISWGEQYIPGGWAALLQATTPLITMIFAHFLTQDDRLNGPKIAGIVVGFVGVGLLMLPELRNGSIDSIMGMLAIVGSSTSYAIAAIYARKQLKHVQPVITSLGLFTAGSIYMLPLSLLIDKPFSSGITLSGRVLGSWITLAMICSVLAYLIYYRLINNTSATFATMVTYVVPVTGLLLGALVLGEALSPIIALSAILIFSGILLVRREPKSIAKPANANE